jgi:hypothetical protein
VWWTDKYDVTKGRYTWNGNQIDYADGRPGVGLPIQPFGELDEAPLDLIREYRRAD